MTEHPDIVVSEGNADLVFRCDHQWAKLSPDDPMQLREYCIKGCGALMFPYKPELLAWLADDGDV